MTDHREDIRAGLSRQEALLLSVLSSKGKRIISVLDVRETLRCSSDSARRIISDLIRKRWLEKIIRGKYLIIPLEAGEKGFYTEHEFILAGELVKPYYIGFWSALNYHGMTEQVPFTVFVATTKRRPKTEIHNTEYRFVTLTERKFFGYREYSVGDKTAKISDAEKTILDCLDHLEHSGGIEEVAKALKNANEKLSLKKLIDYALRMGDGAVVKRLRCLLYLTGYNVSVELDGKLKKHLTTGFPLLDPFKPARGKYSSKWKLRMNVSEDRIRGADQ